MSKPAGSWDKAQKRWIKMIEGERKRVTCQELGLPEHLWTRDGSERAAKEYFDRLREKLIVDRYAAHPELKLLSTVVDAKVAAGDGSSPDTIELEEHLREASRRPSGATREDTELERRQRRQLEEMLDVDLRHVPQFVLTKLIERDAVKTVKKPRAVDSDRTLAHLIDVYLGQRQQSEDKELKAVTTIEFDRHNLKRLRDFFGAGFLVDAINFESWHRWGEHCQSYAVRVNNKTARSTLTGSRSFLTWLLKTERITRLPSNFDDYKIPKEVTVPDIFTDDELRKVLSAAESDLKLYVLLALNTGANQIDLAQLSYAAKETDLGLWEQQIRRKRVKTKRVLNVPVVRYVLWDRTLELIEQYKCQGEVVFRTASGGLLVDRHRGDDGKYKNNDALGLRFRRLVTTLGIPPGKTFKTLRATSASKLGNNKDYRIFGPLFLGQAPDGIYEQHYLQEDCRELNRGVAWLETELPLG